MSMGRYNEKAMIKNVDATNFENRSDGAYSDEFKVYRASIYKTMGKGDDRLQVRPLPYFQNIDPSEEQYLPCFPPLVNGQVITGLSEQSSGTKAEQVWILAIPDFSLGYVIGKANTYGESQNHSKKYPWSYNYDTLKNYVTQRRVKPDDFDYEHCDVIKWVATPDGGALMMMNYRTGDFIILNSSGTIFALEQKKIYLRVGTPPDPPSAGPGAFSAITMDADNITFKSTNVAFDAKHVLLSHEGAPVMLTGGSVLTGNNGGGAFASKVANA
jgi:hypothetical protein